MDIFLGKVTQQAMNYAIRSGVTITASYAIRQSSRLLKVPFGKIYAYFRAYIKQTVEGTEREELQTLQERLQSKIKIISPAIDMIELIAARGNTSLESAVSLTKNLRWEIQALGQRLQAAANDEDLVRRKSLKARTKAQTELELKKIIAQIKRLLDQIEDAVPLINLAITTSGINLSTSLPSTVSPSRLLQASTFLTAGDTQYSMLGSKSVQIGPTFTLSLYMLFSGHVRPQREEDLRESTWKEVIHKARVKLVRVPLDSLNRLPEPSTNLSFGESTSSSRPENPLMSNSMREGVKSDEYAYQMVIVEDLDDGRVHTFEDNERPGSYDDIEQAGIREVVPIHEISKIFYADTGKILNIGSEGETNSPILLLKRDLNAISPRRMVEQLNEDAVKVENEDEGPGLSAKDDIYDANQAEVDAQIEREHRASSIVPEKMQDNKQDAWKIPPGLDPEWLAFEVYVESEGSDTESDAEVSLSEPSPVRSSSLDPRLTSAFSNLQINGTDIPSPRPSHSNQLVPQIPANPSIPAIRTSLSLLETLLRLLSLQQFQQTSHLSIPDELLNFFLSESATTGAATGDEATRRRLRNEARMRVGFDPYDESPIKRRGEEYQYHWPESQAGAGWNEQDGYAGYAERGNWQEGPYGPSSPRYDEGYDTRGLTSDSIGRHRSPNSPLMISNRGYWSRRNTPDLSTPPPHQSSSSSNEARRLGTPSPRTPSRGGGKLRPTNRSDRERISSPLARVTMGQTRNSVESSPASGAGSTKNRTTGGLGEEE